MSFFQAPPSLGNQYDDDPLLREYLARMMPADLLRSIEDELRTLGELAAGELYALQLADRANEPRLTQWDAWGNRVDEIELSPLWKRAQVLAAEHGLVAVAYERRNGALSRVHQFALNYVVQASLDVYSCPLAMTDGAARTLLELGNRDLIDRAIPHLTSRDPSAMWTSGQWMTERTGGSDVGLSETVARREGEGYRLTGTKWFTSATTSEMALTLARPEGGGEGGKGLALFYVELRDEGGRLRGVRINRLKDKLGTRKVPTAELSLEDTPAIAVRGLSDGVRNISSMLNITRTWNAGGAIWGMRRSIALARDYATKRVQFGARLSDKPLHRDTLDGIEAEFEGAFHLAFRTIALLGRIEAREATEREEKLFRLLTPITKLLTARQAVHVASEAIESFGGAGYVEDTGLPTLLRDAQVLPIWEGTTNVLSLDTLRVAGTVEHLGLLADEVRGHLAQASDVALLPAVAVADKALSHALAWLASAHTDPDRLYGGARRFAMTLGRALELSLLAEHAQACLDAGHGPRALAAAQRFARHGVDLIFSDENPA